jgi:hypothetical protein
MGNVIESRMMADLEDEFLLFVVTPVVKTTDRQI